MKGLRKYMPHWAIGLLLVASAVTTEAHASPSFRVGPAEYPANVPQEFVRTKSMEASVSAEPVRIDLGDWMGQKSASLDGPLIVGASREIAQTKSTQSLASTLQWRDSASGGLVAAVSVRSGGAEGLRLGLVVDQLPGSAMLRLYTDFQPQAIYEIAGQRVLQTLQANLDAGDSSEAGKTWWAPSSSGDQVTLEIELPPGLSPDALRIAMPRVMHIYENLSLPVVDEAEAAQDAKAMPLGNPLSCHLDVKCYSQVESQRKGVARMAFVTQQNTDGSYNYSVCTGSLLNDMQSSKTPYFLTAAHCISTQTLASALETDWFYTSTSCGSNSLSSSSVNLRNGAQLLYSSANPDVTLLKLNDTPPAGAILLGWDSSVVADGANVVGVHHPDGGLQKVSFGSMLGRVSCAPQAGGTFNCQNTDTGGNYYYVSWSQGLTQGGSSGSPLFSNGLVTGVLSGGGGATCPASSAVSIYPSLNSVFPALRKWLVDGGPGTVNTSSRKPVYRFYNTKTATHFFTAKADERDFVIANYPVYQYEGVGFYASAKSSAAPNAVYRFYNLNTGAHFYTIDPSERDYVTAHYPVFKPEGEVWYARQADGEGSIPMYRFYNTVTGAHFYTILSTERDFVIANYLSHPM